MGRLPNLKAFKQGHPSIKNLSEKRYTQYENRVFIDPTAVCTSFWWSITCDCLRSIISETWTKTV